MMRLQSAILTAVAILPLHIYWSHIGRESLAISDVIDTGVTGRLTTTYKF